MKKVKAFFSGLTMFYLTNSAFAGFNLAKQGKGVMAFNIVVLLVAIGFVIYLVKKNK